MREAGTMRRLRAIGLISGGLDSYLAARLMKELKVDVILFHAWIRGLYPPITRDHPVVKIAEALELPLIIADLSEGYIPILEHPKYGYGRWVNPCIDCKAFFLREAKRIMYYFNADFVFTGEVLGQRPKSQQNRKILEIIERESGLWDRLLRPLSAKLMRPTYLERMGLIPRDRLLAIRGRSRKEQLQLASQFRFRDYSPPAGGCILTNSEFATRFKRMRAVKGEPLNQVDWWLLRLGRHFDLGEAVLIVPRGHGERGALKEAFRHLSSWKHRCLIGDGYGFLLSEKPVHEETLGLAIRIVGRYFPFKGKTIAFSCHEGELLREQLIEIGNVLALSPEEIQDFIVR